MAHEVSNLQSGNRLQAIIEALAKSVLPPIANTPKISYTDRNFADKPQAIAKFSYTNEEHSTHKSNVAAGFALVSSAMLRSGMKTRTFQGVGNILTVGRLVIATTIFLAASTTHSEDAFASGELTTTFEVTREFDRLIALLGDDVLRDMVCRLSSERYTPAHLSSALGLPEGQVLRRINVLRGWGLVRMVRHDSLTSVVEPLPGSGTATLRRWADKYCFAGDSCGTRVSASTQSSKVKRGKSKKKSKGQKTGVSAPTDIAYWLLKSEPGKYSWDDMVRDKRTYWDGVRNYQASNNLKAMKVGDRAFFYHSVKAREIVGIVEIAKTYYPDPTDSSGRFGMVDVVALEPMAKPVHLSAVKADRRLADLALVRQSRLSVMPVSPQHWKILRAMGGMDP